MYKSDSIISAFLALIVLLSLSAAVLAENADADSQQPASQGPAMKDTADAIKLRTGPGDPVAGKDKAALCFGCHGEDGNSMDPSIPKLAGQYGIYIAKQVRNYLASTRSHMIMSGMAASVSDADLDDIAAYFASQPMMKGDHPSDNKIGKKLFENDDLSRMMVRCNNCHGATGKGQNPGNPVYPVIGGQHKDYLLAQLLNFRKGLRNNSPGGVMNITVHRLSDAELEALADYISGL
jgi:cytochrome c553